MSKAHYAAQLRCCIFSAGETVTNTAMHTQTKRKVTRRPRAERVQEICSAARDAFAAHGYDGAVMADIATAADVAEGTIYKLFESKRELLFTVMEDWYRGFIQNLAQALGGMDDPAQKLRYLIWYHLAVIKDDPALCRVFFREIRAYDDYRGSVVFNLNRDYTAFAVDVLQEGIDKGVFRDDLPLGLIRDTVFGGLEHYVWQFLAGEKTLDVELATAQFWQLIIAGITTRTEPEAERERLTPLIDRLEAVAARIECPSIG